MDDATHTLVLQWLQKADRDIASAERLLEGNPPLRDTAVYHCQQAAEKALKAYLASHNRPQRKIHDLTVLVSECRQSDPSFADITDAAETLTPYGTAFRYPGTLDEPEHNDALQALELAQRVIEHIRGRLQLS